MADVVCGLNGKEIVPKPGWVQILPDWSEKYAQKSSLIYLPPIAQEHHQPVFRGTIVRLGENLTEPLELGMTVLMQPGKGAEVGTEDTLYYVLPENEILAIINQ